MSKALQLHQVRMIQRSDTAPPGQYLLTIEVRFDQPYHRRHTRAIRRGEKSTPAFGSYQLCEGIEPIDHSPFVFGPKIHCSFPSGSETKKEEKSLRQMKQRTTEGRTSKFGPAYQELLSFIARHVSTRAGLIEPQH